MNALAPKVLWSGVEENGKRSRVYEGGKLALAWQNFASAEKAARALAETTERWRDEHDLEQRRANTAEARVEELADALSRAVTALPASPLTDELARLLEGQPLPKQTSCTHKGIGLPGCATCDPRTVSEGGPRPECDCHLKNIACIHVAMRIRERQQAHVDLRTPLVAVEIQPTPAQVAPYGYEYVEGVAVGLTPPPHEPTRLRGAVPLADGTAAWDIQRREERCPGGLPTRFAVECALSDGSWTVSHAVVVNNGAALAAGASLAVALADACVALARIPAVERANAELANYNGAPFMGPDNFTGKPCDRSSHFVNGFCAECCDGWL